MQAALRDLGLPPENFAPSGYRPEQPLPAYQLARSRAVVHSARASLADDERLLVLDDVAFVIESISEQALPRTSLSMVEQKVFGMRKVREVPAIRAMMHSVPLVNVAESRPKKTLEAAFLGKAMAQALARSESKVFERMQGA